MTARDPPQFTPAQVLEAGRRAESEGRGEYAGQFYRHLTTSYPGSPEAAAAQAALARMAAPQNGYALSNPFDTSHGADPQIPTRSSYTQPPARASREPEPAINLPRPVRDYRTARFLAVVITWLGGLSLLAGAVLIPVAIFSPRSISGLPLIGSLVTGPRTGLMMLAAGVAAVFVGQLVRALLDQANATRDLAAISRAQAESRHPQQSRRGRR